MRNVWKALLASRRLAPTLAGFWFRFSPLQAVFCIWKVVSFPLLRRPKAIVAALFDLALLTHRSVQLCSVLRPRLKADKDNWVISLSEAVSSAPPQHQWSCLRALWQAIDPTPARPLPTVQHDDGSPVLPGDPL
eukprot:12897567-Prorocentrum_lima.AAC.1